MLRGRDRRSGQPRRLPTGVQEWLALAWNAFQAPQCRDDEGPCLAGNRGLQAAEDLLGRGKVAQEPLFLFALSAVLEVLPPPLRALTGFDPAEAGLPSASDFEVRENLRRLAYADRVGEPTQLSRWQTERDRATDRARHRIERHRAA